MKKQTAVEWLEEKWNNYDLNTGKSQFRLLIKQAIEKEKRQIGDAYVYGNSFGIDIEKGLTPYNYYNETFNKDEKTN